MPSSDEALLDRDFDDLCAVLSKPDRLNPAQSDPVFYLVYRPDQMLAVKRKLPAWLGKLRNMGLEPLRVSLGDIMGSLARTRARGRARRFEPGDQGCADARQRLGGLRGGADRCQWG